jgi:hypothetical protein
MVHVSTSDTHSVDCKESFCSTFGELLKYNFPHLSNAYLARIAAIVLLLLQRSTRSNNYIYRHRHYIAIHQQPLCVAWRQNTSSSPYAFFQVINPRNVLLCHVAQPVSRARDRCGCVSCLERYHSSSRISLYLFVS